ncbi:MAG TPA: thioredoxin domain-containing protein [Pseudonocardiaceae bacterium]
MTVGGAQRGDRKRNQQSRATQAARAVAAARGSNKDRNRIIIGVVVIVVIAAAVVGGVLFEQHRANVASTETIPAKTVAGSNKYPVTIDKSNATVLVGKSDAKIHIDNYEDFLCPYCDDFEKSNFDFMEQQLEAGTVQIRYHLLNLLDDHSQPAGYSIQSANTALAVATVAPDKFVDFHYSLYEDQPKEGGPGWTQAQLTSLANRLGVSGPAFDSLVNGKTYNAQIQKNLTAAVNDKSLWATSVAGTGFGTPTIVANGTMQNVSDNTTNWLKTLLKTAYPS